MLVDDPALQQQLQQQQQQQPLPPPQYARHAPSDVPSTSNDAVPFGARFVLGAATVKIFAKLLSAYAKVGEEAWLEFTAERVVLRTLNNSKSAFIAFMLAPAFFEHFSWALPPMRCKVFLKPCLNVFKSVSNVERCSIWLSEADCRLVFELQCKLTMKKIHKVPYEECEAMQAIYNRDDLPHRIVTRPRYLQDALTNFHPSVDEITIVPQLQGLRLKSYADESKVAAGRAMHTELQLSRHDFEDFFLATEPDQIGELTFCLKETRAALAFGEASQQLVTLYFDRPGRPILFSIGAPGSTLHGDFVLATLIDVPTQSHQTPMPSASSAHGYDGPSASPMPAPAPMPTRPFKRDDAAPQGPPFSPQAVGGGGGGGGGGDSQLSHEAYRYGGGGGGEPSHSRPPSQFSRPASQQQHVAHAAQPHHNPFAPAMSPLPDVDMERGAHDATSSAALHSRPSTASQLRPGLAPSRASSMHGLTPRPASSLWISRDSDDDEEESATSAEYQMPMPMDT